MDTKYGPKFNRDDAQRVCDALNAHIAWLEHTYVPPKLYPKQSAAFFNDCRYSWIKGSTKSGKSVVHGRCRLSRRCSTASRVVSSGGYWWMGLMVFASAWAIPCTYGWCTGFFNA